MKGINFICPFFVFCVILSSLWYSSSGETICGQAMCETYCVLKSECNGADVPVTEFPKECTSFLYDGLYVDANGSVSDMKESERPKGNLDLIGDQGKPVIVMVVRENWWNLLSAMKNNTALMETEIANWEAYLGKHTSIKGMALYLVEMGPNDTDDNEYTTNLIDWITAMKQNFPHLKFGLFVSISRLMDTNYVFKSLDLQKLDPSMDFYRMQTSTALYVMECKVPEAKYGDILMNVCNQKVQDIFDKISISKTKIIWGIWAMTSNINIEKNCDLMYDKMCAKPNGTYCANRLKDFYDMGVELKDYGGFCLIYVDMDDAREVCQCGKFPIFYALYNGITGRATPKPCPLIDRP